ncbi:MAG: hypothetical protein H0U39_09395 [Segetibacter sp.]|nr:hypothetical protein [Segetibacter sp.]
MLKLTGEIIGYRLFVNIFNRTRRSVVDEVRYYETNENRTKFLDVKVGAKASTGEERTLITTGSKISAAYTFNNTKAESSLISCFDIY